jgi:hypothetical protein
MKRIEIHLTENEIRKLIERWQKNKATDNVPTKN